MMDGTRLRSGSVVLTAVARLRRRLSTAWSASWTGRRLQSGSDLVPQPVKRSLAGSRAVAAPRTLGRWIRGSSLHEWLTREPTQDSIVIDLRETRTLGPILAGIDRLADRGDDWYRRTTLPRRVDDDIRTVKSAPVAVLGTLGFVALLSYTMVELSVGSLTDTGLGIRLVLLGSVALLTRLGWSWEQLRDGPVGRLAKRLVEPPSQPVDGTASRDPSDE